MPIPPLRLDVQVSLEGALGDADHLQAIHPLVARAMAGASLIAGEYVKAVWMLTAGKAGLHDRGGYIRGIDAAVIATRAPSVQGDLIEFTVEVVNHAPHAGIVEDGHAAFHLPDVINWGGPRVKFTKNGVPFLHIPFRHAAYQDVGQRSASGMTLATLKTMMPSDVYARAKKLTRTIPQRQGPIHAGPNAKRPGAFLAADRYAWGGRMHRDAVPTGFVGTPEGAYEERRSERQVGRSKTGPLVNPAWQSSKLEGMFKSGPARHSQYMTIRTITPNSAGWNIPAQAGHGIARAVGRDLQTDPGLQDVLVDAIRSALDL